MMLYFTLVVELRKTSVAMLWSLCFGRYALVAMLRSLCFGRYASVAELRSAYLTRINASYDELL